MPVHKSQNSSLMGYRSIASCPKYLKRLCLPLRPQNNGCKAKNWIACAIGLSSPTDLHWHRSQSVYPPSAYAIYQQRKIHFPADGFRFSHSSSNEKPVITLFTKVDHIWFELWFALQNTYSVLPCVHPYYMQGRNHDFHFGGA